VCVILVSKTAVLFIKVTSAWKKETMRQAVQSLLIMISIDQIVVVLIILIVSSIIYDVGIIGQYANRIIRKLIIWVVQVVERRSEGQRGIPLAS